MTESAFDAGDHIDGDVCIGLVAGLIHRRDLDRILQHVGSCRSCEEKLIEAGGDWETIRSTPAPKDWGASTTPAAADGRQRIVVGRILRVAVPLSIAAAILMIVQFRVPPAPTGTFTYWIPETGQILKLRNAHSADADSAFWIGLNAYHEREVQTATLLLEESKTTGGMEDLRRLHLASLLVNSGRAEEALGILRKLEIESLPQPWRADAYWMEYLALLTLGRSKEAGDRLTEMVKWPGRIGDLARERKSR